MCQEESSKIIPLISVLASFPRRNNVAISTAIVACEMAIRTREEFRGGGWPRGELMVSLMEAYHGDHFLNPGCSQAIVMGPYMCIRNSEGNESVSPVTDGNIEFSEARRVS